MAVTHLFDTKYHAQQVDTDTGADRLNQYRVIIGDSSGTVDDDVSEMELMAPGLSLSYQGNDNMVATIMGSALNLTARLTTAQLATLDEALEDTNEGETFVLLFNSHESDAKPYWYGHLLKESVTIQLDNTHHIVDMTFTDGLGSLRGRKWEDTPGVPYTGRKKLSFFLREIVSKLPAYEGYKDYITNVNHLNLSSVPVLAEVGWPDPEKDGNQYDERDFKFDTLYVRAGTFNEPKQEVDRLRVLDSPLEYLNAYDVLDDICVCFGATAAITYGRLTLACRQDIATLQGTGVFEGTYDYNPSGDSWTLAYTYSNSSGYIVLDADDAFAVLDGATRSYTMPISEVHIVHEEGGSDALVLDGVHHLEHGRGAGDQGIFVSHYNQGIRKDIKYLFQSSETADFPHLQSPADPTEYMGFEARTVNDIEFQSGEEMRLQFGGNVRLPYYPPGLASAASGTHNPHVGSVVIVRVRIEFTTTDDVGYRLSRTVHTHAKTDGALDFITIDNVPVYRDTGNNDLTVYEDRKFFRKLYNDIEWIKDDDSDYDADGWFEIIVPHGTTAHTGDDFGAPVIQLTENYDGQPSYAPFCTQVQGDNAGPGVILESENEATEMQYFQEDITIPLPYGDAENTTVLDFETFDFEMGAAEYEHDAGPRGNAAAESGWIGDTPLWKSAYADGTGGSKRYSDTGTFPDFVHFMGMRVYMGDGSESADLVTKRTGGDGYELLRLGSTRLGSRIGFVNHHILGTVWGVEKNSDTIGDFDDDGARVAWNEKWQWRGHRAGEIGGSQISNTAFDSIHSYYCDSYLQMFGKSRPVYNMSLVSRPSTDSHRTLLSPFQVIRMKQLHSTNTSFEWFMPMSFSWTMNEGLTGTWLKVGQARDLSTVEPVNDRPFRGSGGIIGLPPGPDVIDGVNQIRQVTDLITVTDTVDLDANQTKLDGIADNATANDTDANLKDRANHTGTQIASTISDFDTEVSNNTDVSANVNKLAGIADNATANDTDANLKDRANHTGTQTASTISDFDTEVSNNTDVSANVNKLAGIADNATANDTDANLKDRANHTGTQTASTISDFDTEVSNNTDVSANVNKLAGIADNATANDTDANLKDRANHTGTQLASTISDFQDKVSENTDVVTNKADIATDRQDAEAFNFFLQK